ncbi:molybdopterin-binding protein [soil metagenome]
MQAFVLDPAALSGNGDIAGAIIAEEVRANGKRLFHKGDIITIDNLASLELVDRPIHAIRLQADDIHEDEAGSRLAAAVAGPGTTTKGPIQSRVNIKAAHKGLLRIDVDVVIALNRLDDIAVFTLIDRLAVLPGKVLAGVKITPVATSRSTLEAAEAIARKTMVVQVKPFLPLKVGVVSTEGMNDKTRERFQETVRRKVGWYGGSVLGFSDLPNEAAPVAKAIEEYLEQGAELIMTGGGNTIDPLDAALLALPMIGGEIVKFGAPAHPGSMFWLAYRGDVPVFNLASCSMYSKATSADLILPWIMAGERVSTDDVSGLGYGGLLDRDMQFRFPPYESGEANDKGDEGDEEE